MTDPHTAVGLHVYDTIKDTLDGPTVALACAHPAKFPDAVENATARRPILPGPLADLFDREEDFTILPNDVDAIRAYIEKLSSNG
jgi:threonine synthase